MREDIDAAANTAEDLAAHDFIIDETGVKARLIMPGQLPEAQPQVGQADIDMVPDEDGRYHTRLQTEAAHLPTITAAFQQLNTKDPAAPLLPKNNRKRFLDAVDCVSDYVQGEAIDPMQDRPHRKQRRPQRDPNAEVIVPEE